jgi:transcriptional regulator of acetoin/glycerol metabolism
LAWDDFAGKHISLRRCITATGDFIDLSDLPEQLQHRTARLPGDEDWQPLSLDEVRKVHIQKVLQMAIACGPRRFLGIGRISLYRYLRRDGSD